MEELFEQIENLKPDVRSMRINGLTITVCLNQTTWEMVGDIARIEGVTVENLLGGIHERADKGRFRAAIEVFVSLYWKER